MLSTLSQKHEGYPSGSMVDFACDANGSPILAVSNSRLPLVLADKVQRSKALVECEGESIDLSGDLGSVGRVVVSGSTSGNQDVLLDLKGTIYKMTILPLRTLCVVSFEQSANTESNHDIFTGLRITTWQG